MPKDDSPFFTGMPKIGAMVSTYGTPQFVHMQLEILKNVQGFKDILVHDDCSADHQRLSDLVKEYSVDYSHTIIRQGHVIGDLGAFMAGLSWAKSKGLDYLVKISRRMLILEDWVTDLLKLLYEKQNEITVSFPIRPGRPKKLATNWIVFHVDTWLKYGFPQFEELVRSYSTYWFGSQVEWWVTRMAGILDRRMGIRRRYPYHDFDIMSKPYTMWKTKHTPTTYFDVSQKLGLDYSLEDFHHDGVTTYGSRRWNK